MLPWGLIRELSAYSVTGGEVSSYWLHALHWEAYGLVIPAAVADYLSNSLKGIKCRLCESAMFSCVSRAFT